MKGKIMGLPTYVWLGVIAGGLLLGLYLRSRSGGSSAVLAGQNTSYPTSLPFDPGLAGSSLGGTTSADTSALDGTTINDLLNGFATLSTDVEANTEQIAGLTDQLGTGTGQLASSGGSGSSVQGKRVGNTLVGGKHKETKLQKQVRKHEHKTVHKRRKKVAA